MSITPQEVGSFFLTLVVRITTGIAAAWFTAKFALSRFYHEKWWEKKHAAYNQLIDILFEIKAMYDYASDYYEAVAERGRRLQPLPDGKVDWVRFRELNAQLHRFYVLAPISLSPLTRELLNKFFQDDAAAQHSVHEEGYPDFIAYYEMAKTTQNLIDAIVLDAEFELKFK